MKERGREFVLSCLSPLVGVMATPDVDDMVQINGLSSFVDFIRPFGRRIEGKSEYRQCNPKLTFADQQILTHLCLPNNYHATVNVRDSQGQSSSLENFILRFADLEKLDQFSVDQVKPVLLDAVKQLDMPNAQLDPFQNAEEAKSACLGGMPLQKQALVYRFLLT
jgi:hypothetical protein